MKCQSNLVILSFCNTDLGNTDNDLPVPKTQDIISTSSFAIEINQQTRVFKSFVSEDTIFVLSAQKLYTVTMDGDEAFQSLFSLLFTDWRRVWIWNCLTVCILSLCRSSCTVTTWTASTSWFTLRSYRRSSAGWCRRTTWARGRGRCWTTPTTRRPTTARSPTPCRYKTWRETWRKTCPQKPWRGGLIISNTSTFILLYC